MPGGCNETASCDLSLSLGAQVGAERKLEFRVNNSSGYGGANHAPL